MHMPEAIAEAPAHVDQIVLRDGGVRRVQHEMRDAFELVQILVRVEHQRP